jgi:hypothetical protein
MVTWTSRYTCRFCRLHGFGWSSFGTGQYSLTNSILMIREVSIIMYIGIKTIMTNATLCTQAQSSPAPNMHRRLLRLRIPREFILQSNRHLDIHATQFLNQKLSSIWHSDLADCLFTFAEFTVAAVAHLAACCIVSKILSIQTWTRLTLLANINIVRIRTDHQSLKQQLRSTVCNQTITFHLTQTQSTVPRTTFGRLPRQDPAPYA